MLLFFFSSKIRITIELKFFDNLKKTLKFSIQINFSFLKMNQKSVIQNPQPNRNQGLDPITRVVSTPTEGQIQTINNNEELKRKIQTNQRNKVYYFKKQRLKRKFDCL